MRVIDLLVKIANEDEIPEKIKYENYIYWYDKDWKDYKNAQVEFRSYLINSKYHNTDFLNDEVEVIEDKPEDKKIEKLDYLIGYNIQQFKDLREYVEITTNDLFGKTNKIVDKINEIIDKMNEK
jgi:hypothetical protein